MTTYTIEVACDTTGSDEFVAYLNSIGHDAKVGSSTGNYIDGVHTSADSEANDVMTRLWVAYCDS